MTTRGPSHGVDQRPARRVAQHEHLAALGAVHEGLADVAVDDELAALGDLGDLVLGVAVDVHLEAVHAAGGVVAVGAVEVDAHAVGRRAQAHAVEALPAQAIDDEPFPTRLVGLAQQDRVAVVALGREALAVDAEQLLAGLRGRQPVARVPGDPPPGAVAGLAEDGSGVEEPVELVLEHPDDGRAALVAGREAPVVELGEQLDGRGARLRIDRGVARHGKHVLAEPAQLAGRPRGHVLRLREEGVHVALVQLLLDVVRAHRLGGARLVRDRL